MKLRFSYLCGLVILISLAMFYSINASSYIELNKYGIFPCILGNLVPLDTLPNQVGYGINDTVFDIVYTVTNIYVKSFNGTNYSYRIVNVVPKTTFTTDATSEFRYYGFVFCGKEGYFAIFRNNYSTPTLVFTLATSYLIHRVIYVRVLKGSLNFYIPYWANVKTNGKILKDNENYPYVQLNENQYAIFYEVEVPKIGELAFLDRPPCEVDSISGLTIEINLSLPRFGNLPIIKNISLGFGKDFLQKDFPDEIMETSRYCFFNNCLPGFYRPVSFWFSIAKRSNVYVHMPMCNRFPVLPLYQNDPNPAGTWQPNIVYYRIFVIDWGTWFGYSMIGVEYRTNYELTTNFSVYIIYSIVNSTFLRERIGMYFNTMTSVHNYDIEGLAIGVSIFSMVTHFKQVEPTVEKVTSYLTNSLFDSKSSKWISKTVDSTWFNTWTGYSAYAWNIPELGWYLYCKIINMYSLPGYSTTPRFRIYPYSADPPTIYLAEWSDKTFSSDEKWGLEIECWISTKPTKEDYVFTPRHLTDFTNFNSYFNYTIIHILPIPKLKTNVSINVVNITFNITYGLKVSDFEHVLKYTINSSTVNLDRSRYTWRIYVTPYMNYTIEYPDTNKTQVGIVVSGSVSDLQSLDEKMMICRNGTNTQAVFDVNITVPTWLLNDNTIDYVKLIIETAGNVTTATSSTVKASIEIYNFTVNTFDIIDFVAYNTTVRTIDNKKVYVIENPEDYISNVIWIRFNYTDTNMSVNPKELKIDYLKVTIVYINETEAKTIHEITITFPFNSTIYIHNITLSIRANGTGTSRSVGIEVTNASGVTIVSISNATFSTTWSDYVIPIESYHQNNLTIRIVTYLQSTLDNNEEIDIGNIRLYISGISNLSVISYCTIPTVNIFDPVKHMLRRINCTIIIPLTRGLEYSNSSVFRFEIPKYFRLSRIIHAYKELSSREIVKQVSKVIEFVNALENGYTYVEVYEDIAEKLNSFGVLEISYYMPINTISLINITLPTPFMFIIFDNGSVIQNYETTNYTLHVNHYKEFRSFKIFYGKYFNETFYTWINLSNPNVVINDILWNNTHLILILDFLNTTEINIKSISRPWKILINSTDISFNFTTSENEYRLCVSPCYYWNGSLLRLKLSSHSVEKVVIDYTFPKVISLKISYPRKVFVNEKFIINITVKIDKKPVEEIEKIGYISCNGINKTLIFKFSIGNEYSWNTTELIIKKPTTLKCVFRIDKVEKSFEITIVKTITYKTTIIQYIIVVLTIVLVILWLLLIKKGTKTITKVRKPRYFKVNFT